MVHPIKAEFELQYTLVESVEEAKALVALYERYADFPEVVERVLAGEDEEFVLIDLGLFKIDLFLAFSPFGVIPAQIPHRNWSQRIQPFPGVQFHAALFFPQSFFPVPHQEYQNLRLESFYLDLHLLRHLLKENLPVILVQFFDQHALLPMTTPGLVV